MFLIIIYAILANKRKATCTHFIQKNMIVRHDECNPFKCSCKPILQPNQSVQVQMVCRLLNRMGKISVRVIISGAILIQRIFTTVLNSAKTITMRLLVVFCTVLAHLKGKYNILLNTKRQVPYYVLHRVTVGEGVRTMPQPEQHA